MHWSAAESVLAKAKLNLSEEVAKSEQALKDWENLGNGEATELVLRKPHLIDAEANVKSAQADLEKPGAIWNAHAFVRPTRAW